MIASLLLCLVLAQDPMLDAKMATIGRDVPKLVELANTCAGAGQDADAKRVYRKILEIDPNHEAAHKALNHPYYDKKWFESFAELAKYKREEAAKMKAKGLARFKDEWVPEADAPFLIMGWVKNDKGAWSNPLDVARQKQVAEWTSAGYQFRADDNSWIAPADFERWAAKSWKIGNDWVELDKANEYHAKFETPWQLVGEHFTVSTTCEWDGGSWARFYADKSYPELVRIFGVEPAGKPRFVVLNSLAQYNLASGGNPPLIPESEGISSLHGGYFADQMFDLTQKPAQFMGAGICYWDRKDPKLRIWGTYWVRWAAAQSFVDAIDPSWTFVADTIASTAGGGARPEAVNFWIEKKIPRWLRYGAASYVERFMKDPDAAAGADPWDLRVFAFSELKKAGGIHKLDEVFAFALDPAKDENSKRLYQETGLLVAFLLDGAPNDKKLAASHEAFKAALKTGSREAVTASAAALQKELASRESEIKKFAGL